MRASDLAQMLVLIETARRSFRDGVPISHQELSRSYIIEARIRAELEEINVPVQAAPKQEAA